MNPLLSKRLGEMTPSFCWKHVFFWVFRSYKFAVQCRQFFLTWLTMSQNLSPLRPHSPPHLCLCVTLLLFFPVCLVFFLVLSASDAQVRARAPRMTARIKSGLSRLQSRLTWSLWHLPTELLFLGSLQIQLMVRYGKDTFNTRCALTPLLLHIS